MGSKRRAGYIGDYIGSIHTVLKGILGVWTIALIWGVDPKVSWGKYLGLLRVCKAIHGGICFPYGHLGTTTFEQLHIIDRIYTPRERLAALYSGPVLPTTEGGSAASRMTVCTGLNPKS